MKKATKQTFSIFWQHIKPYWLPNLIIYLAVIAAIVIEIVIPLYYKKFFDILSESLTVGKVGVAEQLVEIVVFVLVLSMISWVFWRIAGFTNNHVQPKMMANLNNTCFSYLHNHSYRFFINKFVGALVRKVNRLVRAFERISDRVIWDLTPLFLQLIFILIVLFLHNKTISIILLVWTLIYMMLMYLFSVFKLKYDIKRAAIDSEVTGRLADTITNNINVKIFSAFSFEFKKFKELTDKQFRLHRFTWGLAEVVNAIQHIFMALLEFIIFYYAIKFWQQGLLSIGDFVLIQAYVIRLFMRLWGFGRIIRDMYENLADAEEMVEILSTPHEVKDKPGAKRLVVSSAGIEFKHVNFTYTKTRDIISNFNLTIKHGEKVGIVGPSGAGKSTLTAILFRYFDLQSGKILIDGQNIIDVKQDSLRESIGFVPQDPILFHRTLMENIRYGKRQATDEEVKTAARLAHCDEFIHKLPDGYQTYVGERGIKLSGGERQRVAIARAILKNAPILVLDEATSSLDSHSELMIQDALSKLMKGKTVIVIAHRLSTIMKMDRIIVLENGCIIETGNHQELLENKEGIYKKLWDLQVGGFVY